MTRSEPPVYSSQPVQPEVPNDAFCVYLAKQFIVKQGFQPARVAWVEDELAGIEFETLLHEAVLEQLKDSLALTPQSAR